MSTVRDLKVGDKIWRVYNLDNLYIPQSCCITSVKAYENGEYVIGFEYYYSGRGTIEEEAVTVRACFGQGRYMGESLFLTEGEAARELMKRYEERLYKAQEKTLEGLKEIEKHQGIIRKIKERYYEEN